MGLDMLMALVLGATLLGLNLWASVLVWRDDLPERAQRVFQLLFVWLVPLIGALVLLGMHRAAEKPSGQYQRQPDPGDDYGHSGKNVRALTDAVDGD